MNQVALDVEQGIVAGVGEPESLGGGTKQAGEDPATPGMDGFVRRRLDHESRTPQPTRRLSGMASHDQKVGSPSGWEPGIGNEKRRGFRFGWWGGRGPWGIGAESMEERGEVNRSSAETKWGTDGGDGGGVGWSGAQDRQKPTKGQTGQMEAAVVADRYGCIDHCPNPVTCSIAVHVFDRGPVAGEARRHDGVATLVEHLSCQPPMTGNPGKAMDDYHRLPVVAGEVEGRRHGVKQVGQSRPRG